MSGLETGDILVGNPEGATPTFLLVKNNTDDFAAATRLATKGSVLSGYVPDMKRRGEETNIRRYASGIWGDVNGNGYAKWDGAPVVANLVAGSGAGEIYYGDLENIIRGLTPEKSTELLLEITKILTESSVAATRIISDAYMGENEVSYESGRFDLAEEIYRLILSVK